MRIRYTQESFVNKINIIHNYFFDYSKTKFTKTSNKIIIICPKHGEFEQLAANHLKGIGCKLCGYESQSLIKTNNTNNFISKAIKIHGNYYDYSKVEYIHSMKKIIIICPKHGEFEQTPNGHLNGQNCYECSKIKNTLTSIILKANKIHNNFYDYSKLEFTTVDKKAIIICPKHGEFEQRLNSHLQGNGCPSCSIRNSSYEEFLLNYFKNNNINLIQSERNILQNYELDFYLQDYNLSIEINGLYWHSNKFKNKNYHFYKTIKCNEKNINLIHIFEDEFIHKKDIILSRINYLIGKNKNKIFARKCIIKNITKNESELFIQQNSLDFYNESDINLGLFYNEKLISVLICEEKINKEFEIIHYCNEINLSIIGGFSKLLKYFEKNYLPNSIIVKVDRRWFFKDNIFTKNNFKLLKQTVPNFYYLHLNKQKRFKTKQNNDLKIYDSGNLIYEKKLISINL